MRDRLARNGEHAAQIDLEHPIPVRVRNVGRMRLGVEASDVADGVETATGGERLVDQRRA